MQQQEKNYTSVIICTYNRADSLKNTLETFTDQTVPCEEFEVIVINDGSEDNTIQICNEMQSNLPNLKVISNQTNSGLANAANLGIEASKGDHILFTDDDCLPEKNWIEAMRSALINENIVAGAVNSPKSTYLLLCHNISQFYPFIPGRRSKWVDFIAGASVGFRRSVLNELGCFEKNRRDCPDMELILRARMKGHKIYYCEDATVTHNPQRSSMAEIFKYSAEHASQTIFLRCQHKDFMRTPFVLRSKWLVLLAAPLIAFKVTFDVYTTNFRLLRYIHTFPIIYALKLAWCWGASCGLREMEKDNK